MTAVPSTTPSTSPPTKAVARAIYSSVRVMNTSTSTTNATATINVCTSSPVINTASLNRHRHPRARCRVCRRPVRIPPLPPHVASVLLKPSVAPAHGAQSMMATCAIPHAPVGARSPTPAPAPPRALRAHRPCPPRAGPRQPRCRNCRPRPACERRRAQPSNPSRMPFSGMRLQTADSLRICRQSVGEDALDLPRVARIPNHATEAAALHGRDLAFLVPAQRSTGALQLGQEMLAKVLVPEQPVRHAEPVAKTIQAQRVDAFDDTLRISQVPAHPAVDVRARLDPARELFFAGALEIPQACRRERLTATNAARLTHALQWHGCAHARCLRIWRDARLRIRQTTNSDRHGSRSHLKKRPSASARHAPARNHATSPIAAYSRSSIRTTEASAAAQLWSSAPIDPNVDGMVDRATETLSDRNSQRALLQLFRCDHIRQLLAL